MRAIELDVTASDLEHTYTISTPVVGHGRFVRQTCGGNHFAMITLRLEPTSGLSPLLLDWQVTQEQIPEDMLSGVIEGIRSAFRDLPEDGRLSHIKISVIDGRFHPVDSRALSYTVATSLALKDALSKAHLVPLG